MYYLSRFDLRKDEFYIVDTEDNIEECIGRYQLNQLLCAGVEIKGIKCKISHSFSKGTLVKLTQVEPYVMPSAVSAKAVLLYGFHCSVDENDILLQIIPEKSSGAIELSKICRGIAAHAFSKDCLKGSCTFVFDDSLTLDNEMFSRWAAMSRSDITLVIRDLSNEKAEQFYTALGTKCQDYTVVDHVRRRANNIGHQCFIHGIPPLNFESFIRNRRIWDGEFDEIYAAVRRGIPVTTGWNKRSMYCSNASKDMVLESIEEYIRCFEETGEFTKGGVLTSFYRIFALMGGRLASAKLLANYVTAGGNDSVLLNAFHDWLSASYKVLFDTHWGGK